MTIMCPEAVIFVGTSGSGKTTLLEKVIAELVRRGLRVGAVKHGHHRFEIDHPGKDSYRFSAAGAAVTLISSAERLALVRRHDIAPAIEEILQTYFGNVDLVLIEGFKRSALPKIEVHRREHGAGLICRGAVRDEKLLAVASDEPLDVDVPLLDVNDATAVADFIAARVAR